MASASTDKEIDPSPLPHNSCLCGHTNLPSPDVSRRLPAELLASIFICIARDSFIDAEHIHDVPAAVNVSYVCRYWRDVALICPTLWSYIPVTSQRWTEELLARSQMAPLKIGPWAITSSDPQEAQILFSVRRVMNSSHRIQELNIGCLGWEAGDQVLSILLSTHFPCLQCLEISGLDFPEGKSLSKENTPALHTLSLRHGSMPWSALGSSVLTTLELNSVGAFPENTMADFLAMLRRMPQLIQLHVHNSLPSARDFLSNGEFDVTPTSRLPHLSDMSITRTSLSAATALFSCVDIPLRTKVLLRVQLERTSEHTLDDCVRLASLLTQRVTQSDSPKCRSLIINSRRREITFIFRTSERVDCDSDASFCSIGSDDNALLAVSFLPMNERHLSGICSAFSLTNIQSIHFLIPSLTFSLEFWRDMLTSLSDVRHIRFSGKMPNITSMLSVPFHPLKRSWEDGQGEIFVPALEELELYRTTLVLGRSYPCQWTPHVQDLYDAIATRKETRCQLIIKDCCLVNDGDVEDLQSVGRWEGDQFRVASNSVRHVCH